MMPWLSYMRHVTIKKASLKMLIGGSDSVCTSHRSHVLLAHQSFFLPLPGASHPLEVESFLSLSPRLLVLMCHQVGLIFFGTVDTSNDLRESLGDAGDYQHVVVARDRHSYGLLWVNALEA